MSVDLAISPEEKERRRKAKYQAAQRAADSDIGKLPPVSNQQRRDNCEYDLHKFLVTYFPNSTGLRPFGAKQVEAIKHIEHAILNSGRTLNLLPRGYCKSSISEVACIWATLYGHRKYVLFLGANDDSAGIGLDSIKTELETNELLYADFPEVCVPIRHLDGANQKCRSQKHEGKRTHIMWTTRRVVLPSIAGSKAGGAIIRANGLLAASRGARFKRPDGSTARPDFSVIDDPQTDQSAESRTETSKRLRVLSKSILRLGGHGYQLSVCVNATLIAEGDMVDQLSDRKKFPSWQTIRTPTVLSMPVALESMWLKEYADLLCNFDENDIDGQRMALDRATAFYSEHREEMDAGGSVAWEHVMLEPGEISALQHALNILILDGEDVFEAECQNSAKRKGDSSSLRVTAAVKDRKSGYKQGEPMENASFSVFHVDVHDEILYFTQATVRQDFTGAVVNYGSLPEQPTRYFGHNNIKKKLIDLYPGTIENAITQGLVTLLQRLAAYEVPLACGLVDAGYKPEPVAHAIRLAGVPHIFASKGIGIGPAEKPMPEYDLSAKRCLKKGPDPTRPRWYFPREFAGRVHFDANFWKDFGASRLIQAAADGAWSLFGDLSTNHEMYADHLSSEHAVPMSARGRTCNVWKLLPARDNHYWDTFVGCVVAASIGGAMLPGQSRVRTMAPRIRKRGNVQNMDW